MQDNIHIPSLVLAKFFVNNFVCNDIPENENSLGSSDQEYLISLLTLLFQNTENGALYLTINNDLILKLQTTHSILYPQKQTTENSQKKITIEYILLLLQSSSLLKNTNHSKDENAPLVLDSQQRLYIEKYYSLEKNLANMLLSRLQIENFNAIINRIKNTTKNYGIFFQKLLSSPDYAKIFPSISDIKLDKNNQSSQKILSALMNDKQWLAALLILFFPLIIISGGPGTGKTLTIIKILLLFIISYEQTKTPLRVVIAAPTGKAKQRAEEAIDSFKQTNPHFSNILNNQDINFQTIHRLLGFQPHQFNYRFHVDNPLNYDLIILDETSMIDLPLMHAFFAALSPQTRVVLLGDHGQLSSVEIGSIFGDIVHNSISKKKDTKFSDFIMQILMSWEREQISETESNIEKDSVKVLDKTSLTEIPLSHCIVHLDKNYRFNEKSGIGHLSQATRAGDTTEAVRILTDSIYEDVHFIDFGSDLEIPTLAYQKIDQIIINQWKSIFAHTDFIETLQATNQFMILSPFRSHIFGVRQINARVEKLLIKESLIESQKKYYHKQPIMITSNAYNLGLYNGDMGMLDFESNPQIPLYINRSDTTQQIALTRLPAHETAYSMTVHKSQGSEYHTVLFIISPANDSLLFNRELIYTAITRSREKLIIAGRQEDIKKMIAFPNRKQSALHEYLWPPE